MNAKTLILMLLLLVTAGNLNGQADPTPATTPAPTPTPAEKANERPAAPPRQPEPWDDADVKSMASQCVTFETRKGSITMELYPESAPESVRNFLNLVSTGALDTTTFHRVVPGFVIQGGNLWTSENLTNELKWRATRTIRDEPNQILHERGVLSMARGDEPETARTSFFILLRSADTLDGKFAAFGRVTNGMDVVEAINGEEVDGETPKDPVRILKATAAECVVE